MKQTLVFEFSQRSSQSESGTFGGKWSHLALDCSIMAPDFLPRVRVGALKAKGGGGLHAGRRPERGGREEQRSPPR